MSPTEIIAILAMTTWAIYKQTVVSEVTERGRFTMAIIYGIVALAVGGFAQPHGVTAWVLLAVSITLSVVVGTVRGLLTKLWVQDGRIVRQGTALTVGLFLALVLSKFVLGAFAQIDHIDDGAGFGEVMLMIAVMVAVQAQIIWVRARSLTPRSQVAPETFVH